MLDYEIKWYTVCYVKSFYGKVTSRHMKFLSEDEAIEFIKKHRSAWIYYNLEQTRSAIIDF